MAVSQKPQGEQTDYEDLTKVQSLFDRCCTDAKGNSVRLDRDKQDLQNLLFKRGGPDNHWSAWDENSNSWKTIPTDDANGIPSWVPRSAVNIFGRKIDSINAILNQSTPALEWKPSTDDDADRAAAEVADDAMPVLLQEIDYPDNLKKQINGLISLVDKVAVFYYYDNDEKYGTAGVQLLNCPSCGTQTTPVDVQDAGEACPECGQTDYMEPALNPDGSQAEAQYPKGKLSARVVSSLEFSIPRSARSCDERQMPWVLFHNREDKHECLRLWPDAKEYIEAASRDAKWSPQQRAFADQMMRLSSPRAAARGGTMGGDVRDAGPVVYRLVHDPIVDDEFNFPDGLICVSIGNQIVEVGPLPVLDEDDKPVKPVIIRTFSQGAGSPFGQPPADDLVPLQRERNIVATLLLMILLHNAAPRTFIPLSVQLEDDITGIPGQDIRYRSTVPGEKPTTEPGRNPPEGLYKYLEMLDQKFDELSGLNAVLQGIRPAGDPTLGEVQRLEEHGQAQFKTPLDNIVEFEKKQARMLLWIARRSAWSPRFLQVRGENGGWDVQQFYAASLKGAVDVFCEHATAWPKSPLARQLKFQHAVEMGLLNPQDTETQEEALSLMDLTDFKKSYDVDRQQVVRQLDKWKSAQSPADITPPQPFDNLPIHLHLKSQWLKTEEAEQLAATNPPLYQAMVMHVQQLQALNTQAQMQQAVVASGKPPAPPPTDKRPPAQRGDGSAVQHAVNAGVLKPAGKKADPVHAAVASGVLKPAQPQADAGAPAGGASRLM